jgi:hypothetical protein
VLERKFGARDDADDADDAGDVARCILMLRRDAPPRIGRH